MVALCLFLMGNDANTKRTCGEKQVYRAGDVTHMHDADFRGGRAEWAHARNYPAASLLLHAQREQDGIIMHSNRKYEDHSWHSSHGASVFMALLSSPSPQLNCVLTHFGSIMLLPRMRKERGIVCAASVRSGLGSGVFEARVTEAARAALMRQMALL